MVVVGEVDQRSLNDLVAKTERYIERKIRTLSLTPAEFERLQNTLSSHARLLLWQHLG